MRIDSVFFDLYGTLLIYGDMTAAWAAWLKTLHKGLKKLGLEMSRKKLARRCEGFFSRPAPPFDPDGLTIYERRLEDFTRELGLDPDPDETFPCELPASPHCTGGK